MEGLGVEPAYFTAFLAPKNPPIPPNTAPAIDFLKVSDRVIISLARFQSKSGKTIPEQLPRRRLYPIQRKITDRDNAKNRTDDNATCVDSLLLLFFVHSCGYTFGRFMPMLVQLQTDSRMLFLAMHEQVHRANGDLVPSCAASQR